MSSGRVKEIVAKFNAYSTTTKNTSPSMIERTSLTLGKILGSGGFATVYLAKWRNQQVAVKECDLTKQALPLAEQEKNVMYELSKHAIPGIVKYIGYTISPTHYSIVMEYMPNGTLADYIDHRDAPLFDARYTWAKTISQGLASIHHYHYMHLDIKSLNILLDKNMQTKISDFGFSKKISVVNQHSGGSLDYAAPEIFNGLPSTEKSDIYSYGILLLEIANWRAPHKNCSEDTMINFVLEGKQEKANDNVPKKLSLLATWCRQFKPKDRPKATEITEILSSDINVIPDNLLQSANLSKL